MRYISDLSNDYAPITGFVTPRTYFSVHQNGFECTATDVHESDSANVVVQLNAIDWIKLWDVYLFPALPQLR